MSVGTDGDDVLPGGAGNETLDGLAGNDTVSYATAGTGVVANLATGIVAYQPKIMPLGDSITYGIASSAAGGYRGPLWDLLRADGLTVNFVGSVVAGNLDDPDNEGHGGWTINDIRDSVEGWLTAAEPDIVLLIIGTNDTSRNPRPTPETMIDRLSRLIDDIATTQANPPKLLIGPSPPMTDDQPADRIALIQAYNALIPDLVAQKRAAGVDVTFVDMSDLTPADITPEPQDPGLHPNASGYQKIANNWHDALVSLGTDNGTLSGTPRDQLVSIENLEGSAYQDVLTGDGGANRLVGLGGADILDGGGGGDTLTGGVGNDVYVVDDPGDQVVENVGEGTDTVRTSLASYTLGSQVEKLTFIGSGAFAGTGNELANSMTGGAGNDTLNGGNAKDTLIGGLGDDSLNGMGDADRLEGGAGNDIYGVNSTGDVVVEMLIQADGGGIDTVQSAITYTLGANVENLTLTGSSTTNGTGNADANVLIGNTRDNVLNGAGGDDTIDGAAGADTLTGGPGADMFRATSASRLNGDVITDYSSSDQIVLLQNLASSGNVQLDTSGANLLLKIDGDNNGSFETVLTLQGAVPGQLLVGSGFGFTNNVIRIASTSLSVAATDATKAEGNSGTTGYTFTVTRAGDLSAATTADWAVTGSGGAPANAADFGGALPSGQVSFAAGESSNVITVEVSGDMAPEPDEGFTVTLSNPSDGAGISQAAAAGAITDDDGAPSLRLAATDASKAEGDSGSIAFTFTVNRSGDLSAETTADWAVTGSGAAPADDADFGGALPSGQVSFAVGESSKLITVDVAGDTLPEAQEGFTVTLSNPSGSASISQAAAAGAIINDDFMRVGTDGDDVLPGGAGNETLDGLAGNDTVSYATAGTGVVANLATGIVAYQPTGTPSDQLVSIENLEGSAYQDVLTGDGGANRLVGLGGADSLDGAGGADTLTGGVGNDVYVVDDLGDQVVENVGEGTDTVRTSLASYTLGSQVEKLTFIGSGAFAGTGNELANSITGGDGNDTLDGGNGKDTLIGGLGDDSLNGMGNADRLEGGAGNDTYGVNSTGDVVVETLSQADGGGIDTVESATTFTLGANIEYLTLTGTSNLSGTGNGDANVLTGNSGNNVLDGAGGADTMAGMAGKDTYIVDNAGDVVSETNPSTGADAGGYDTVNTTLASYTLGPYVEALVYTNTDPSVGFQGTGNELDNTITAGTGDSTLHGASGKDTLKGGSGADKLNGDDGNDKLEGAAGADTLAGGLGTDTLTGGADADQFLFTQAVLNSRDTIADFTQGPDKIAILGSGFDPSFAPGALDPDWFVAGPSATATGHGQFVYDSSTKILSWDADGQGGGAGIPLAIFSTAISLQASDFLVT